jgi:hypothetical protein
MRSLSPRQRLHCKWTVIAYATLVSPSAVSPLGLGGHAQLSGLCAAAC